MTNRNSIVLFSIRGSNKKLTGGSLSIGYALLIAGLLVVALIGVALGNETVYNGSISLSIVLIVIRELITASKKKTYTFEKEVENTSDGGQEKCVTRIVLKEGQKEIVELQANDIVELLDSGKGIQLIREKMELCRIYTSSKGKAKKIKIIVERAINKVNT